METKLLNVVVQALGETAEQDLSSWVQARFSLSKLKKIYPHRRVTGLPGLFS